MASRQLRFYLFGLHLAAAGALFLAAIDPVWRTAGLLVLFVSGLYYWRPAAAVQLRGDEEGNLHIYEGVAWRAAQLEGASVILPLCSVLRLRIETDVENRPYRKLVLLVLTDCLSEIDFRRLRVWLRWRGSKALAKKSILHSLSRAKRKQVVQ